jgi:hypothetical protein
MVNRLMAAWLMPPYAGAVSAQPLPCSNEEFGKQSRRRHPHLMKIFDNPASNLRGECNSDFGFLL